MKRIVISTLVGCIVAGGLCATGAFSTGMMKFTPVALLWILLNRSVMGFVIGASGLRLHWAWNGLIMGIAVGSTFSYFMFMSNGGWIPLVNFFVNGVFGLIVEFLTTKVFKQPSPAAQRLEARAAAA
jgi:hypothetical protein